MILHDMWDGVNYHLGIEYTIFRLKMVEFNGKLIGLFWIHVTFHIWLAWSLFRPWVEHQPLDEQQTSSLHCYAPVNVMPHSGKHGQTMGNLTHIMSESLPWGMVGCQNPPTFPRVHIYFCYKIQCHNPPGLIKPYQNPQGSRNVFHQKPQGCPSSPAYGIILTGALVYTYISIFSQVHV